jgi:hypothetical protein
MHVAGSIRQCLPHISAGRGGASGIVGASAACFKVREAAAGLAPSNNASASQGRYNMLFGVRDKNGLTRELRSRFWKRERRHGGGGVRLDPRFEASGLARTYHYMGAR